MVHTVDLTDTTSSPQSGRPATINLNDEVRVTLTAAGVEMMRRRHNGWAPPSIPFKPPSTEEPTTFQLWVLMREFGPGIGMGLPLPFTSTELELIADGAPGRQGNASQPSGMNK